MNKKPVNQPQQIDLLELFFELLAHWKLLLVSMIMCAAIGFIYTKCLVTPMYSSTAELYVFTKSTSITSLSDLQLGTVLTNDYVVVVKGRPVLEQVITDLNLDTTYSALSSSVTIDNPDNSRILSITVTNADPNMAKQIADEIAVVSAEYIAEKMDQDPPSVIQYGYADGRPINISTFRSTAMGALIGLVLAGGVVTLLYLINDSIQSADDITNKLGMNVLGTMPYIEAMDVEDTPSKRKNAPHKTKVGQKGTGK